MYLSYYQQILNGLTVSALVFFNLLCIVSIFVTLAIFFTVRKTTNKITQIGDTVEDKINNIGAVGAEIFQSITPLFFTRKRQSNIWDFLSKIVK